MIRDSISKLRQFQTTWPASSEETLMGRPSFSVHTTRRILDDDPIARTITSEAIGTARFARAAPRVVREDERLYISGAFTLAELETIVSWARGTR